MYDTPDQTLHGSGAFGCDVASGGDIDGDGYDDLVVANDWGTTGAQFWVYSGAGSGELTEETSFSLGFYDPARWMAADVSMIGDTNGDGYDDVAAAGVWFAGSETGLLTAWRVELVHGFSNNAAAGDVNGDGYDDAIFGSVSITDEWDIGHVHIFDGGPDGMTEDASYLGAYNADSGRGEHFGWAVAGGMDLNGDGYSDVLGIGQADARVFYGASTGFPGGASVDGQSLGECSQCEANNAGDVDGDGYDEVAVIGSEVTLAYGGASGVDTSRTSVYSSDMALHRAMGIGDFDSDGYADLFMMHDNEFSQGIFLGGRLGPAASPVLDVNGPLGIFSLGAGDMDGDGVGDLIGGAAGGGEVYVFLGSTITDPSRASTDTGGDSGSDTHSHDTDSAPASDSDSAADSGAADTAGARKTGCGRGCDATGGGVELAQVALVFVALVRRRSLRG